MRYMNRPMSRTTQKNQAAQEEDDITRLCEALRATMKAEGVSSLELAELTDTPEANIRRMMSFQEPKVSFILKCERAMNIPLGTVLRRADCVDVEDTPESLLATDPRLHRAFRRTGPETVAMWIRLSDEMSSEEIES